MEWSEFTGLMDAREDLYNGSHALKPIIDDDAKNATGYVRNIVMELIETQVDPNIPQPKITAPTKDKEENAKTIEDILRNETDRQPMEMLNDIMERIVKIQGGGFLLVEWDNSFCRSDTVGELATTYVHPKQFVPQAGVYTSIEDMDHFFLKLPQTKANVKRIYGVNVDQEAESEPEIRGAGENSPADDMVTQYVVFYRGDDGRIGKYSWVNDTELCDYEDYYARRVPRCKKCGELWTDAFMTAEPTTDGERPEGRAEKPVKGVCPYCGSSSFQFTTEEFEEIWEPISAGAVSIPGASIQTVETLDSAGNAVYETELVPVRVPYYKPDVYPLIMIKSVSVFGQLLGESDVDRIADQQNAINRISAKILDILLKGGSYITIPNDAAIELGTGDMKPWRIEQAADLSKFGVFNMTADISQLVEFRERIYEDAREQLGITDSYQGRKDTTATSGVAKEFSAQQAAGRLESKRVAKNAGWAGLYEVMFKTMLAFADEPRPVVGRGLTGDAQYGQFNRYAFLATAPDGSYYWDADYLFATDESAALASNRSAMWQEITAFYQAGAFGDPTETDTQILFWNKLEVLHYPGAGETRRYLEEKKARDQEAQEAALQQQQSLQMQQLAEAKRAQTLQEEKEQAEFLLRAQGR